MGDLSIAADEGKKLVKMLNSVRIISEALDQIGSLEQAVAEVNGRLEKAQELEAAEIKKRDAIAHEAEEISSKLQAEIKEAKTKAAAEKAKAAVELVLVQEKVRNTASDFDHMQAVHGDKMGSMLAELSQIEANIVQRSKDLEQLNDKIFRVKAEAIKMLG